MPMSSMAVKYSRIAWAHILGREPRGSLGFLVRNLLFLAVYMGKKPGGKPEVLGFRNGVGKVGEE